MLLQLIRWPILIVIVMGPFIGGLLLRQRHVIICREYFLATFVALIVADLWMFGTGWVLWGWPTGVFDVVWFTGFNLIYPWEPGFRPMWRNVRQHRDHEEDCEYGPRRRRGGALAKLKRWTKVSLNPVFAPT